MVPQIHWVKPNSKGVILPVYTSILDQTTGEIDGKSGILYSGWDFCSYFRSDSTAKTPVTLVTMTLGTWTSSGFIEVDGTNAPGLYMFGVPDAALLQGASWVEFVFKEATSSVSDAVLHINLVRSLAF